MKTLTTLEKILVTRGARAIQAIYSIIIHSNMVQSFNGNLHIVLRNTQLVTQVGVLEACQ